MSAALTAGTVQHVRARYRDGSSGDVWLHHAVGTRPLNDAEIERVLCVLDAVRVQEQAA